MPEGRDQPAGGPENERQMIDHGQISKRFMRRFNCFSFAGPLRRMVPAISKTAPNNHFSGFPSASTSNDGTGSGFSKSRSSSRFRSHARDAVTPSTTME
jgi:hypothetical protein